MLSLQAQDLPKHLELSKKSPLPFSLQPGTDQNEIYSSVPSNWYLDELENEMEYRFQNDSTQQVLILYIDEDSKLDGAQFLIKKGEQIYSEAEFKLIVEQFSEVWGDPSEEIGKYIWELEMKSYLYYITLENLAPYQLPGASMNFHTFQASN